MAMTSAPTGFKSPNLPIPDLANAAAEYTTDAAQRWVLFLDVLRQRGNAYREHAAETAPNVLEFNCRFGDPETQSVLKRLDSDILDIFDGMADGSLEGVEPRWSQDAALCLVLASAGYPGAYSKGSVIRGIEDADRMPGVTVFHAGTAHGAGVSTVTSGGRVLGVTARARTLAEAREHAYDAARKITFDGMIYRTDIGAR